MKGAPKRIELTEEELREDLERVKAALGDGVYGRLRYVVDTLLFLTRLLEEKRTTIKRLRNLLFGSQSEKTENVLPQEPEGGEAEPIGEGDAPESGGGVGGDEGAEKRNDKKKKTGHGRNGAEKYTGARQIEVPHESLEPGDGCPDPECKGKVYRLQDPATLVRLRGEPPVSGVSTSWRDYAVISA